MKIVAIKVGKKHDKNLKTSIEIYEKRLKKYCQFSWHIIPSSNIDKESSDILRAIGSDDVVVLLDETGQNLDNDQLADYIEKAQVGSVSRVVFVIGGAYGVNNKVMSRANMTLSLSSLVFPHQIVRLILVEQIYRTYSIISGSKYHHD